MIEIECFWNRNISRKKTVLKHGSYPAFTKHGSITDRAVLEQLSLNSTSGFYIKFLFSAYPIDAEEVVERALKQSRGPATVQLQVPAKVLAAI